MKKIFISFSYLAPVREAAPQKVLEFFKKYITVPLMIKISCTKYNLKGSIYHPATMGGSILNFYVHIT